MCLYDNNSMHSKLRSMVEMKIIKAMIIIMNQAQNFIHS